MSTRALPWNPDEVAVLAGNYLRDKPDSFWDAAFWDQRGWSPGNLDVADRRRFVIDLLEWLE